MEVAIMCFKIVKMLKIMLSIIDASLDRIPDNLCTVKYSSVDDAVVNIRHLLDVHVSRQGSLTKLFYSVNPKDIDCCG